VDASTPTFHLLHETTEMARALPRLVAELPAGEQAAGLQLFASLLAAPAAATQLVVLEARRDATRCGVALAQLLPGRAALCWPPRGDSPQLAAQLFAALLLEVERRGTAVAQGLIDIAARGDAEAFLRAGFQFAGELVYMAAEIAPIAASPVEPVLSFVAVAADDPRLAATITDSYRGSLDCPLVDGWRAIDDVLAGYQGTGIFRPELWQLAMRDGAPVGCLLLSEYAEQRQGEIVYLGLTPAARGNGWGRLLLEQAVGLGRTRGWGQLLLAVDAANHPARRIYQAAGFLELLRRQLFVRRSDSNPDQL
jgi:mycothiol synthase